MGEQRAHRRRGAIRREVGVADAEALAVLGGQVDAVQASVLAHVADEVRELEGDAEAAEVGMMARGTPSSAAMIRPTVPAEPSM